MLLPLREFSVIEIQFLLKSTSKEPKLSPVTKLHELFKMFRVNSILHDAFYTKSAIVLFLVHSFSDELHIS